ncbi:hypothetical protein [Salinispora oceanensis]|uniref:hypothetical protein n=1 Tax=Salinispora oceanensis TaxID=1050199 RepID=UPI00037AED83|nr:hypothetical protein [Salinispora oceanensis]
MQEWIDNLDPLTHARVVQAIDLLVAGDKAGRWQQWYTEAIPLAEQRYEIYLKERAKEGRQL